MAKKLNRRSGKTAGTMAIGKTDGDGTQAAEQANISGDTGAAGCDTLPSVYTGPWGTRPYGTPDPASVHTGSVRQWQTAESLRSLLNIARAVQENRESGKVPLGTSLPPVEEVLRNYVAAIPERLLRGVLVGVTQAMLDHGAGQRNQYIAINRLREEQRREESRRGELHQKFTTLTDAVKLVTKIADAL